MRLRNKSAGIGALFVLGILLTPLVVPATTVQFHDKDNFLYNDFVDWRQLGPAGTLAPDSFTAYSSVFGFTIAVSKVNVSGDFIRLDQGFGFFGNFTPGDALLFTTDNIPPANSNPNLYVRLTFPLDVLTAGLRTQPGSPESYGADVDAYDKDGNKLGHAETAVTPGGPGTDTAAFVGIGDPDVKIRSILIYTQVGLNRTNVDFAFDRLEFYVLPCAIPAPVPGSVWLLSSALISLAGWRVSHRQG